LNLLLSATHPNTKAERKAYNRYRAKWRAKKRSGSASVVGSASRRGGIAVVGSPLRLHTRVRLMLCCWSIADERGNEFCLGTNWEGRIIRVQGEIAIVRFDLIPGRGLKVLSRHLEPVSAPLVGRDVPSRRCSPPIMKEGHE
jgi:hypothetical protein